jgi:hypothetical protein
MGAEDNDVSVSLVQLWCGGSGGGESLAISRVFSSDQGAVFGAGESEVYISGAASWI